MMADTKWRVIVVLVFGLLLKVDHANSSKEIMKKLTTGFGKALSKCKTELNLPDHIMQDFTNFWKEDYDLVNRELGCAVMCMASKLDLVTEDLKMHHQNAHEFAKTHGADDGTAKQIVTMIHECEKSFDNRDDCDRVLEIAKCFRTKIHELKWAPSMEEILEEVMTDIV